MFRDIVQSRDPTFANQKSLLSNEFNIYYQTFIFQTVLFICFYGFSTFDAKIKTLVHIGINYKSAKIKKNLKKTDKFVLWPNESMFRWVCFVGFFFVHTFQYTPF